MISKYDLVKYRVEQSKTCLNSAKLLYKESAFADSANRSYYSIFHAMRAVLALDEYDSKKHSGVISYFRQNYIKTGKFDAKYSNIIGKAFEIRGDSDYEDFYVVQKSDVQEQIENAMLFLEAVESYMEKTIEAGC